MAWEQADPEEGTAGRGEIIRENRFVRLERETDTGLYIFSARNATGAHVLKRAATSAKCDEPVNGVMETKDPFAVATLWDEVDKDEASSIDEAIRDVKLALHSMSTGAEEHMQKGNHLSPKEVENISEALKEARAQVKIARCVITNTLDALGTLEPAQQL